MDNEKIEKIGNVTLDYTYYSGEDLYSEGESEDRLLELVKNHTESEYDLVIQQTCSWSVMYHLSHIRENIISWIPFKKTDSVLEIGSGCGAITGAIAGNVGKVTCIELSKKRSIINATRHKIEDNLTIMVGNFQDIEPNLTEKYDYITLIGVLEYAASYIDAKEPYSTFLSIIRKHLKPNGKIIVAIENRMGLKYLAGCKEDHLGKFFAGIEGYSEKDGVRTFSKKKLESLVKACGYVPKFYYPYPDYKLPHTIYSDDKLPGVGELNTNIRNFDADRIVLFDEEKAFDNIIQEGVFHYFSNSFLVVAGLEEGWEFKEDCTIFAKYANERLDKYKISTKIIRDKENQYHVTKNALTPAANKHIRKMVSNYIPLDRVGKIMGLVPAQVELVEGRERGELLAGVPAKARDMAVLEFVNGISLSSYLDRLEASEEYAEMERVISEYCRRLRSNTEAKDFVSSIDFVTVFGERRFTKNYRACDVTNFDVIFDNIMIDPDNWESGWRMVDYEWVFNFPVPIPFLIYRALFYQFSGKSKKGFCKYLEEKGTDVYTLCDIDASERLLFEDMEHTFQVYIIGGIASLEVMQVLMPAEVLYLDNLVKMGSYLRALDTPKIYYTHTKGFAPENRLTIIAKVSNGMVTLRVPVEHFVTGIRIDPTEYPCLFYMNYVRFVSSDGTWVDVDHYIANGYQITDRILIFDTDDAQIILDNLPSEVTSIEISYAVSMLDFVFFNDILNKFKKQHDSELLGQMNLAHKAMRKVGLLSDRILPDGYIRVDL